ncbi:AAA family ATPase [Candidatus Woesearchaeota archaeon]|nr:AAA family ATPase [Candidatus Woesearchaeota archaeon]MBW3005617.1 AAA family ATPase [Candidatus Woesearchaeota archaeon]
MLLRSLKLKNIRSYLDQEIQFPEGTVLLSGDIGTGKSTILLAVEFALFGILRGDLSGNSLLRNGEEKGSVELEFELNNQKITVHRKLKRSKTAVEQEAGFIIKNNMRKDATPQELKTEILELVGYPRSMLSKSKSLVYRYTVYTPQEDMKRIILDSQDSRLDILRKVFDIDKYKRIKENTTTYSKGLREKSKEFAGMIADLEDKKKQKKEKEEQAKEVISSINEQKPKLDQAKRDLEASKKSLSETEEKIKSLQECKKKLEVSNAQLKLKAEQNSKNAAELGKLKQEIARLEEEIEGKEITDFGLKLKEKLEQVNKIESELKEINTKLTAIKTKKQMSQETKDKIASLNNCPTCLQEVSAIHKTTISDAEDSKIKIFKEQMEQHDTQISTKEEDLKILKQESELLREKEKQMSLIKLKRENLQEKHQKEKNLLEQQETTKKEISEINQRKIQVKEEIDKLSEIEKEFAENKKEFDTISQKEKELEIEYNKLAEKKELISEMLENLEKEVNEKESAKKKLLELQKFNNWFGDHFLKLVDVIEKQVMTRVYGEFNELFQSWFNVLVEDEAIQARLDDRFTPIVQQNGYDIEIENLSGGEKTACALAYRLALNKVINDLITSVQTKQLLILDEPTDGFSTEQLDKIRDVLEELNAKQVIIVSHEPKIETFVDHVIHVQKHEHISTANYKY